MSRHDIIVLYTFFMTVKRRKKQKRLKEGREERGKSRKKEGRKDRKKERMKERGKEVCIVSYISLSP